MNRRDLMTGGAAVAVGSLPLPAPASQPSPFPALYAEWVQVRTDYNDNSYSEEQDAALWRRLTAIEDEILALPVATVEDYAHKLIVANDNIAMEGCPTGNRILAEARALIGGAA